MLGARPLLDRLERYFALDVEIAGVRGEQGDIVQHKIPVVLTRTWPDPELDAWADGSASDGLGMRSATPTTDGQPDGTHRIVRAEQLTGASSPAVRGPARSPCRRGLSPGARAPSCGLR